MAETNGERPGIRTSEAWLSGLVICGCLAIAMVRVWKGQEPGVAELLSAALAAMGYAGSRALVKGSSS